MANTKKSKQPARTTGKKTAAKGKSTAARKRTAANNKKKAPEKYVPTEKDLMLQREVKLLVLTGVSLILFLSNFGICGKLGSLVSHVMFGVFGCLAYVVPVLLILGGAFLISNWGNHKATVKFFAGVFMFVLICTFVHMLFVDGYETMTMKNAYALCAKKQYGGGVVGAFVSYFLTVCVGKVGAYIVCIILMIAAFVLLTERSVVGGVKRQGQRVYDSAREDMTRFRENQEYQREERARKRELEKKYRRKGISLGDTSIKPEVTPPKEEMQEVHAEDFPIHVHSQYDDLEDVDPIVPVTPTKVEAPVYKEPEPATTFPVEPEPAAALPIEPQYASSVVPDVQEAEGEPFTPKERIVVSKAAMDTMHRGAYGVGGSGVTKAETDAVTVHEEGDSTDVREVPMPDIATAKKASAASIAQAVMPKPNAKRTRHYILPPLQLLNSGSGSNNNGDAQELKATAIKLQQTLQNFGVGVTITDVSRGPSVTRYELQPEQGTKVSKITSLTDDIKLNLAASDIRIEAPIPGKAAVGIEVPNASRDTVYFRDLITSKELKNHPSKLAFAAGKDIAGKVIVADIAKMPHMLVAGTTGSGKSVFTNSIIMSILYRAKPSEVKLIIVDPKVVEFGVYNGIPHLLIPVVTDPKKAAGALHWAVAEMQDRYAKFASMGVRDLKGYNAKVVAQPVEPGQTPPEPLPQIVIIIDELADLMMAAAKEVEDAICRLAQLARAAGIHLIIATQRPSVDVVTGLIKANIPSRCALLVSSGIDSRTIIDMNGAEKLLGNGDMLFYPSGYVKPVRLQGAFISDEEVARVVEYITKQSGDVVYDEQITQRIEMPALASALAEDKDNGRDEYFVEAARFVIEREKASTSMLQRMFKIGFNRAARIMEQLSEANVVGNEEGTKPRKVLMTMEQLEQMLAEESGADQ